MKVFNGKPTKLSPEKQRNLDNRLMVASWAGESTETVKALLAAGADVHADNDCALRQAAEKGHTETVQVLAKHIFAPDSWHGKTRTEIEAQANTLYDKIKADGIEPEELRKARDILIDVVIDSWHQVHPPPPLNISPLPAQPRPL